jgi:hypothetical protein
MPHNFAAANAPLAAWQAIPALFPSARIHLNAANRRQLSTELADRQPLTFAEGYKLHAMLEANLVSHHSLQL